MPVLNQYLLFSEYNQLMNQRLYDTCAQLSEEELKKDRGAFFKSVQGTLNHILVGDIIWLNRFSEHPSSKSTLLYVSEMGKPNSLDSILFDDLEALRSERIKIDQIIIQWINGLSESDVDDYISYKNMAGVAFRKDFSSLISHLFLHQVHHRGQVTTLLSQAGLGFGDTDIIEIVSDVTA